MISKLLNIDRARQSLMLRSFTIILLWIAIFNSIPQADFCVPGTSSGIQKIISQESTPVLSSAFQLRTTVTTADFIESKLNRVFLEKLLNVTSILDKCLPVHAGALVRAYIYTQTTSSFL